MKRTFVSVLLLTLLVSAISCEAAKKNASGKAGSGTAAEGQWLTFDQALAKAKAEQKFVVVDFYTDWCKWCKVLDQKTYPDPAVQAIIAKSFVLAKVNPEKDGSYQYLGRTVSNADLAQEFRVQGFPTTVYLDQDGALCGSFAGFVPPEVYVKILAFIADGKYKEQSLDSFVNGL
jgi:thioredoxin-related protein